MVGICRTVCCTVICWLPGLSVLCTDTRPGQCTYPFRYERLFKLFSIVFLELVLVSVEAVGFADE
jgi:hypothetical protein